MPDVLLLRAVRTRVFAFMLIAGLAGLLLAGGCGGGGGAGSEPGDDDRPPAAATWAKSYGGPSRDQAVSGQWRPGGGYAFAGTWNNVAAGSGRITESDAVGNEGDIWVVALDELGDVEWQRSYGVQSTLPPGDPRFWYTNLGGALDTENDGESNGTWLVGGVRYLSNGDAEGTDLLVTRLDAADQVVWSRTYDSGPFPHFPYFFSGEQTAEGLNSSSSISPSADGGAVIATEANATVLIDDAAGRRAAIAGAVYVLKVNATGDPQWSAMLGANELVNDEPLRIRVAALPGGGAVVAYQASNTSVMHVVRLDAGTQSAASIRWKRTFSGEYANDLLPADDDADGVLDGILVAGVDGEQGVVRKLDAGDGSEIWRKTMGKAAVGVTTTCVPSRASCNYVATAHDGIEGSFDTSGEVIVRTLALASGNTIGERRFGGIHFGSVLLYWGGQGWNGGLRYLADTNRYQILADCKGGDCPTLTGMRIVVLNAALDVVEENNVFIATDTHKIAHDAGDDYVVLQQERDQLFHMTGFGNTSSPVLLGTLGADVERGYAVHALDGGDGQDGGGFVVAGEVHFDAADGRRRSAWVLRLAPDGDIDWQRRLDGFRFPSAFQVDFARTADLLRPTADGGFLLGGETDDGMVRLLRLQANGDLRAISPPVAPHFSSGDRLVALEEMPDGGYLLAGGGAGAWATRLDALWSPQWGYLYDGLEATDMHLGADGGALLTGYESGEESSGSLGAARLDAEGDILWASSYHFGQSFYAGNVRVAPAADGYVLAASAGDAVDPASFGRHNLLLVGIAADGEVQWTQGYGGLYDELVGDIEALPDGGFLISAMSDSMGDYTESWVLRVGPDGRIVEGCNADLGRAPVVARPLELTRTAYTPPLEPTDPPVIDVVSTSVTPREPADVVVARQCAGTATNDPGNIPDPRTLTVNQAGTSTGVVTSVPQGIVCGVQGGGTCSTVFSDGTLVTLRVDIGSIEDFQRWGDGCESVSGNFSEICTVRMDADRTIDVIFGEAVSTFTLDVGTAGTGAGTVTSTPAGIDCGTACSAEFAAGTAVTLTPTPDAGSVFTEWSGDADCEDGEVTMDADAVCSAIFDAAAGGESFTISVQISNQGGSVADQVYSEPEGIACLAGPDPFENEGDCSAEFSAEVVRLFALPDREAGDEFDTWGGGCDAIEPDPPDPDVCVVNNTGGQRDIGAAFSPPDE